MDIIIRKATVEDAEQMDKINRQILPENYELSFWIGVLSSPNTVAYVIEETKDDTKSIVGYSVTALDYDNQRRIIEHVYSIAILQDYRQKGFGKQLFENTEKNLKEKWRIKKVTLHVRKNNKAAIKFYHKVGYGRLKKVKEYYGKKQDAYLMGRLLFV